MFGIEINKNKKIKGSNNIYACLGASNHTFKERQSEDFYATDPIAAELLLEVESNLFNIYEPCCGQGHLAKVFDKYGKLGRASDLVDRGYGDGNIDFFFEKSWNGDIVTNPPYSLAKEVTEHALSIVNKGRKVCMFLKVQFLEGKERKLFFMRTPPQTIYVSSSRIICAMNGDFDKYPSSAIAYAWFVWEKGYQGDTIVKWIN